MKKGNLRKLVQHSSGYLILLIPKPFEKKHKLVAGDVVEVRERGKALTVRVVKGGKNEMQ